MCYPGTLALEDLTLVLAGNEDLTDVGMSQLAHVARAPSWHPMPCLHVKASVPGDGPAPLLPGRVGLPPHRGRRFPPRMRRAGAHPTPRHSAGEPGLRGHPPDGRCGGARAPADGGAQPAQGPLPSPVQQRHHGRRPPAEPHHTLRNVAYGRSGAVGLPPDAGERCRRAAAPRSFAASFEERAPEVAPPGAVPLWERCMQPKRNCRIATGLQRLRLRQLLPPCVTTGPPGQPTDAAAAFVLFFPICDPRGLSV